MEPAVIELKSGAVLRLRIVDAQKFAVPKATVGLEEWGENRTRLTGAPKVIPMDA